MRIKSNLRILWKIAVKPNDLSLGYKAEAVEPVDTGCNSNLEQENPNSAI